MKRTNIAEIFWNEAGDRWYKVKVNFITIDEKTAVEKKTANFIMVQAEDFKSAFENFMAGMKGTMSDFEIASISETPDNGCLQGKSWRCRRVGEMIDVAKNIAEIRCSLPAGVVLVAVSKFHSEDVILEAYRAGQRAFGESRAQEFVKKASALPADIEWHFIGHLQTNKVRMILPHVAMIQSVDSEKIVVGHRCGKRENRQNDGCVA